MKVWSIAAALLVSAASLEAQGPAKGTKAQSTITVTLGSLGCTTPTGADSFDVLSWSWGASNPTDLSGGGGGGGTGKAVVSDLSLMKPFDACSPALFGAVMTGKAFPTLALTASNKDGTTTTVTLTDVRVSSWQASGSSASDAATEGVTFGFAKVCLADGSSGAKFCYDVKAGKTF